MDHGFECRVVGEFELLEAGTGASGYAGVGWNTRNGKWLSWVSGGRLPGVYNTAADAAIKRRDYLLRKDPSWSPATVVFKPLPEKEVVCLCCITCAYEFCGAGGG